MVRRRLAGLSSEFPWRSRFAGVTLGAVAVATAVAVEVVVEVRKASSCDTSDRGESGGEERASSLSLPLSLPLPLELVMLFSGIMGVISTGGCKGLLFWLLPFWSVIIFLVVVV